MIGARDDGSLEGPVGSIGTSRGSGTSRYELDVGREAFGEPTELVGDPVQQGPGGQHRRRSLVLRSRLVVVYDVRDERLTPTSKRGCHRRLGSLMLRMC